MATEVRSSNRKQDILEALARMLEKEQSSKITTAALAREVGVSEAALYRHFASKAQIFDGLLDYVEETLFSRVRLILDQKQATHISCRQIIQLVGSFSEKNPGITRVLTGDALNGENPRIFQRVRQIFDRIETQLRQLLKEGEVRQGATTVIPTGASANLMMVFVEGKLAQYVRTGFELLPSRGFQQQWSALEAAIFRTN